MEIEVENNIKTHQKEITIEKVQNKIEEEFQNSIKNSKNKKTSLKEKLSSFETELRKEGLLILKNLISEKKNLEEEILKMINEEVDMMFNENNKELQFLILEIYLLIINNEKNVDFNKHTFWYYFFDKFLDSKKKDLFKKSNEFFNKVIIIVDKNNFLDICINLLMKNNSKIIKTIFQILNKKNSFFDFKDNLSKILEAIDKNLTNSNKLIRKKSNDFLKILITKFGIEITQSLKKLKPKDLEELKKNYKSTTKIKNINIKEEGIQNKKKIQKSQISFIKKDLYLKSEPVSILENFPENWCSKVKNTKKWKIKVELCNEFIKKADVNRLEKGNYHEIFSLSKKLIMENIIHLQIIGLKMISLLAKGLRNNLHNLIKNNFGILISKLKDRKFQVIEQLILTINNCFYCISIEEIYEEIKVYNKKRNKDIRMNIISVIKNLFDFIHQKNKKSYLQKFFKLFGKTIDIYFKDQDITIKQANNDMVLYIYDYLENSDDFKIFEKNVDLKNLRNKDSRSINKKRRSSYISQLTTPNKSPRKSSLRKKVIIDKLEDVKYSFFERKLENEELKNKIRSLFDIKIINDCEDKNWKIKKNGIISFNGDLEMKDIFFFNNENVNAICQYIMMICNDFKESNLLINKQVIKFFNLMTKLVKDKETVLFYFIKFFVKKISDKKFFNDFKNTMESFVNFIDFHIIFNIITKEIEKNHTPKILIETNKILLCILKENSKFIKDNLLIFFEICFNHTNSEVRILSTDFFEKYSKVFGTEIISILEKVQNKNLKENLLLKFKELIKKPKLVFLKKKEKSKSMKPLKNSRLSSITKNLSDEKKQKKNYNIYDLVEKINSGDWRQKKFALENYKNFTLENPKYFSPSNINDTFSCVFRRIKDSHRLVIVAALDCLCFQLKKYFSKYRYFHKKILNEILLLFNDKNKSLVSEIEKIVLVYKENNQNLLVCQSIVNLIGKSENLDLKIHLLIILDNFQKNFESLKEESIITALLSIIPFKKKIKDFPEDSIHKLAKIVGKQKIYKRLLNEKSLIKEKIKSYLKKVFPPTYIQEMNLELEKPLKKIRYSKKFEMEDNSPKYSTFLNSVLNFTEPEDTEIANIFGNLSSSLNQKLSKKLFSFESKVIQDTFSKITELNVFSIQNIIQFFQITYIRIYDTTRKIIINTFNKFLNYLLYIIKSQNFVFNAEKETRVIFHSTVRFYLNFSVTSPEIVIDILPFINQHLIFDLCFNLLKNRNCFDSEEKILVLFSELTKNTKQNVFLSIEFVNLLMNLQLKYPNIVLSIFQHLQKNMYFQKFLENPEFRQKFELKKNENNQDKKYNFSDINQLTEIFESKKLDLLKLSTNMIFIMESILNFSDKLIIYQKYTDKDFAKFDKFLFLFEKSCYFKNLFDCLNNFYKQTLFEKLVTYLLILDKKKSEFSFQRENGTLLSSAVIIQRINSVIIRILERNDPNILYDTLFKIIEKCRLNLTKNKNEKMNEKIRKIVIKLTVKILRLEEGKLLPKVDIKKLISLLNLYYGRFKNETDVNYLKGIKTIVSDLVRMKGTELYKYYEYVNEKKEPGFLMIINRFLDKYKEKEDFRIEKKNDHAKKIVNCFKNDN